MPLAILFHVGIALRAVTALQMRRGHPMPASAGWQLRSPLPRGLRDSRHGGPSTDSSPIISVRLAPSSAGPARPSRTGAGRAPRLLERARCPTSPPPSLLWSPRGKQRSRRHVFAGGARGTFAANCAAGWRAPRCPARGVAVVVPAGTARCRGGICAQELLEGLRGELSRTLENASSAFQSAVAFARTRRPSTRPS